MPSLGLGHFWIEATNQWNSWRLCQNGWTKSKKSWMMLDDVPSLPGTFGPKDSTQLQSELEESDSSQTGSLCCLPLWICLNCGAENDHQREWDRVENTALTEGIERMLPRFTVYIYIYIFFDILCLFFILYIYNLNLSLESELAEKLRSSSR